MKRGVCEKVLAMLKGGGTKEFGVVLTRERDILAILEGGHKRFLSFKSWRKEFYPV